MNQGKQADLRRVRTLVDDASKIEITLTDREGASATLSMDRSRGDISNFKRELKIALTNHIKNTN